MSRDQDNSHDHEKQVEGKPWKNHVFKDTFDEADAIRKEILLEDGGRQAKVKAVNGRFAVKVRKDPALELAEKKNSQKKSRKKN